jgi:hypothetical protein
MSGVLTSETITDDELAYHRTVVADMQQAQVAAQEIARLQALAASAEATFRSWGEHLHRRYGLGPGDGVDEEGRITRTRSDDLDGGSDAR